MKCKKSFTSTVALILLFAAVVSAQTVQISDPVQLTFVPVGRNSAPSVATDGMQWGLAYMRYEKTYKIYFLRTTYDGEIIDGHALYVGVEDTFGYQHPRLASYPGGWAMTFDHRETGSELPNRYFSVLDKRGRKTGHETLLVEKEFAGYVAPIWTGSMFVVFYNKYDDPETGLGRAIWVAYFNDKAERIVPDRRISPESDTSFEVYSIVPTSRGFALLGGEEIEDEMVRPFFMMTDLNGKTVEDFRYLDGKIFPFFAGRALWNGDGFSVAGEEFKQGVTNKSRPAVRLLSIKGKWQKGLFRQNANGENFMYGIGFDGSSYVSVAMQSSTSSVYCQQLDAKLKKVGEAMLVDDSGSTDFFGNLVVPIGSDAFYFASNQKAGFSKQSYNVYMSRITFLHSGKPDIAYFNGEVHEFNGKKYVLFDWLAAGCQTVKMKTKGGRWTLPAFGFHAVQIKGNKKVRFKLVASNNAGRNKAKVKIKP